VCNLSLIMGVAGAAGEKANSIVIAGVAGLLAGGFSMAVGEYVSVGSQRELLDYQIELQRHQLHNTRSGVGHPREITRPRVCRALRRT